MQMNPTSTDIPKWLLAWLKILVMPIDPPYAQTFFRPMHQTHAIPQSAMASSHAPLSQSARQAYPSIVPVDQCGRPAGANIENFRGGWRLDPIPPAATKRLEQCRGIGQTVGPRLHHLDHRLQIGLLRI